jgi:hypothetical protein
LNYVPRSERPLAAGCLAIQDDGPGASRIVPLGGHELCARPHVELEKRCVCLEKLAQLVLGREDGPLWWKGQVWQVVVPYRVVQDELVVPFPPVVADALVFIDDQGVDAERLESRSSREAGLTSA